MNAKLQKIPGIYQAAAQLRKQAVWNRKKEKAVRTDPHIAHEAGVSAAGDEARAAQLESQARSDEAIINAVELLVHDLKTSSHQSALRTLAMRDLEMASMRLRRELGELEEG